MKKVKTNYLEFEIDKLTRSIENVATGDSFPTDISHLVKADLKQVSKKNSWVFNWKTELNFPEREVYKLTIIDNPDIVQGLISFTVRTDHVYMFLLESAPFNLGKASFMREFQVTWSHMHVRYHFREVEKDLYLSNQKLN